MRDPKKRGPTARRRTRRAQAIGLRIAEVYASEWPSVTPCHRGSYSNVPPEQRGGVR
jgi:hypothetical protein